MPVWRVTVRIRNVDSWYQDVEAPNAAEAVATFLLQTGLAKKPPGHWKITAEPAPPAPPKEQPPHA